MKRNFIIPVAFFFLLCLAVNPEFAFAKKWTVNVSNNSFTPSNLTHVIADDTIQWVWVAGTHTTTSTSIPAGAATWDSPITLDSNVYIYIPRVNGTFHYQCTPHAATMKGSFVVSGASGISSGTEIPQVTLFPNPFTDYVNIRMSGTSRWLKSLNIYSMKGELIRVVNYGKGLLQEAVAIDLKDLAPGVYMIRITDNLNRSLVRRVVRN